MAEPDDRIVVEGQQYQNASEVVAYTIDLTGVIPGVEPAEPLVVEVRDVWGQQWVTEEVMPDGDAVLDEDGIVTLPPLMSLTAGRPYVIQLLAEFGDNVLAFHIPVKALPW